jgi:signal peptidase I
MRPASLGGPATYIVIRADSMAPTHASGDLVILMAADAYHTGEVVGFRVPAGELGEGMVVVHRIIDGDTRSGFTLRGDGNDAPDPWRPRAGDIVGYEVLRIGGVGSALAAVRQPAFFAALWTAIMVTLLLLPPGEGVPKRRESRRPILRGHSPGSSR